MERIFSVCSRPRVRLTILGSAFLYGVVALALAASGRSDGGWLYVLGGLALVSLLAPLTDEIGKRRGR